jgi:hypothetical protein
MVEGAAGVQEVKEMLAKRVHHHKQKVLVKWAFFD